MPVDTSVYNNIQLPPNALTTIGNYAGLQHQIGENTLQQMDIQSRNALGQAIQASTDPNTGIVDSNELTRNMARTPAGARILLATQLQSQQGNALTGYMGRNAQGQPTPMQAPLPQVLGLNNPGQQAYPPFAQPQPSQDDIDKLHDHTDAIINTLTPLANDPSLDQKKVIRATTDLVADPKAQFNATDAATTLSQMPSGPGGQPAPTPVLQKAVQGVLQNSQKVKAVLNAKYPSTNMMNAQKNAALLAQGGGNAQPPGNWTQPTNAEPEQVANPANQHNAPQNPQPQEDQSTPGVATGLPVGYQANQAARQQHYLDVMNAQNSVPQENAAYSNILNIVKTDAKAPSGTFVGDVYRTLAHTGLFPDSVSDPGAQLDLIKNHAAQIATAGGLPGSDARLAALENAHVGDQDLPQVIGAMVPYLMAVNQSKLAQAQYYQKTAGDGTNPDRVATAQNNWTENFDPRLIEMRSLAADPAKLKEYVAGLSKEDKAELQRKNNKAQDLGLIPDLRI